MPCLNNETGVPTGATAGFQAKVFTSANSPRQLGMTFVEMVVSFAIVVVILTAILPAFRSIQNSWDAKQAAAETLQNGRVLIDHLNYNLSKAVRITDVSDSNKTSGYIQFEDNDGNDWRYEIGDSNLVKFGLVGSFSDLAGPVRQLQFTCYDGIDFVNPTTDGNSIRFVQVQITLTNSATLGQDKIFTTSVYLRTGQGGSSGCPGLVGWWKLDETSGTTAADSSGNGNSGTLVNMNPATDWVTGQISGALDFDGVNDYVSVSSLDSGFSSGSTFTVTGWFNTSQSTGMQTIVGQWNQFKPVPYPGVPTLYFGWQVLVENNKVVARFGLANYTLPEITGTSTVNNGIWHHFALVYPTSSSNAVLYVDGQSEGTPGTKTFYVSNTKFRIGDGSYVYLGAPILKGGPFKGTIDDVRIYNRMLEPDEIAQLANTLKYKQFNEAKVSSDNTYITISTPSASQGDLLIAAIATDGDTSASITAPSGQGWTLINRGAYSSAVTIGAWWKLAGASEPASHRFTWSGGQQAYGWMMQFTGHDTASPINASSASGQTSSTPASPAVTTTVDNCLILRLGAFDDDDITIDNPGLSGHTAITMDESASSSAGAVTYQAFGEGERSSNGTSVTVLRPTGTSVGDLLIAAVVTDGSTAGSLSPPGGWTLINRGSDSSNQMTLGVWWKLAGASEPANYTFTWTGSEQAYGWIMRFTGHDPTTPINASAVQGGSSASSSPPCPSVTTTVANTMIVRIGGFDRDRITVDSPGLPSHTAITMDRSSTGSNSCSGGAGYRQQAAIGASGTSNFSLTSAEDYRTVTIAIAPVVVTGTVSGGAGYVMQTSAGSSGTSTFSLGSSNEARMLTIAITPANSVDSCGGQIRP